MKSASTCVLAFLVGTRIVAATEAEAWLKPLAESFVEDVRQQRAKMADRLKYAESLKFKGTFSSLAEKNRTIATLKSKLGAPPGELVSFSEFPPDAADLKPITVGTPWNDRLRVMQVLDSKSAIVELIDRTPEIVVIPPGGRNVVRSGGEWKVESLWLDVQTAGWTDGKVVDHPGPIAILGTKTYRTAVGSRTILHARSLTKADIESIRRFVSTALVVASVDPEGAVSDTPIVSRKWISTSYPTTIRESGNKSWEEIDNSTGKSKATLKEVSRTAGYIELNHPNGQRWRIRSDRIEMLKDGKWEWLSNGNWAEKTRPR